MKHAKAIAALAVLLMMAVPFCVICDTEAATDNLAIGLDINDDTDDLTVKFALGPNASFTRATMTAPANLTLSGVDVTFEESVAIKSDIPLTVTIAKGTVNRIVAGDSTNNASVSLWGMNDLTIKGDGMLTLVTGDAASCTALRSHHELTITGGADVRSIGGDAHGDLGSAYSCGLFCSGLTIDGNSKLTAIGGDSAVDSSYGIQSTGKTNINNANVTAIGGNSNTGKGNSYGIHSIRDINITNSEVYVESFKGKESYGMYTEWDVNVSASKVVAVGDMTGMKTMGELVLKNGSYFHSTGIREYGAYPMASLEVDGTSEMFAIGATFGLKTGKIAGNATRWDYRDEIAGGYKDWGQTYHEKNYGMHVYTGDTMASYAMITYKVGNITFQDDFVADYNFRLLNNHFDTDNKFLYWTYGANPHLPGEEISARGSITYEAVMSGKDTCSVFFDLNGGTGYVPYMFNVEKGTTITLKDYKAKKGTSELMGWSDGSQIHEPKAEYTVNDNIVFAAVYSTHTVKFVTEVGKAPDTQTVADGEKATEPKSPTAKDYIFIGWYKDDMIWDFGSCTVSEDMELEAYWIPWIEDLVIETDENGRCDVYIPSWSGVKTLTIINGKMSLFFDTESVYSIMDATLHVSLNKTGNDSFGISVNLEDEEFHGAMKVTLPYDTSKKDPQVYWVNGEKEVRMPRTINPDGTLSFSTDHNSTYVIKYAEGPVPSGSNQTVILIVAMVLIIAFAGVGFFAILYKAK